MGIFGELNVRIDPWEVEYGTEIPLEAGGEAAPSEDVALDVEVPFGAWQPVAPVPEGPRRLVFVDGVRRIEAHLVVRTGDRIAHGAFGSLAVGAVAAGERAEWADSVVERLAIVGGGIELPRGPIEVMPALAYEPRSIAAPDPDAPLQAVQTAMRSAEERLARGLAAADTLVVADGPLTFHDPPRDPVVGYVKRLFKLYLPPQALGFLARLPAGMRTPVFGLRSSRRFARYAWFLRLARPGPADADLAGIVRLEVAEAVGLEAARRLADATAALLPRFAPSRGRDPRAPQNLLPIGAVEARLRRQLGDARLIRRRLEALVAKEVARA